MESAGKKPKGLHPLSPSPSGSAAGEEKEEGEGGETPPGRWRRLLPVVGYGVFLEPVSSFPPAPHLSCYLPHHLLLLLFIVYLLNEGGGEGRGLTDSDKPLRTGWRAGGCGAAPGGSGMRGREKSLREKRGDPGLRCGPAPGGSWPRATL